MSIPQWAERLFASLIVLAMMAVPVVAGQTTSRLSAILLLAVVVVATANNRIYLHRPLVFVALLYLVFVATSFQEITSDTVMLSQVAAAIFSLTALLMTGGSLDGRFACYFALAALAILGAVNFPEMMVAPLTGGGRLDVLRWQQESGFFFGINRYLLAIFTVFAVAIAAQGGKAPVVRLLSIFYFTEAVLLGSRAHFLLSLLAVLIVLGAGIRSRMLGALLLAIPAIAAYQYRDAIALAMSSGVLDRLAQSTSNPDASPRGIIFRAFWRCSAETDALIGNDVRRCVEHLGVRDFDNTFLFAIGGGGILSALVLLALIAVMARLILTSRIEAVWKGYLLAGYLLLLNVDVLVTKAVFFLPVVVHFMSNASRSHLRMMVATTDQGRQHPSAS